MDFTSAKRKKKGNTGCVHIDIVCVCVSCDSVWVDARHARPQECAKKRMIGICVVFGNLARVLGARRCNSRKGIQELEVESKRPVRALFRYSLDNVVPKV